MKLRSVACLFALSLAILLTVSESAEAQYLGSGLFKQGTIARGNLGAFTRSNFGASNFNGRFFRGNANIIPPPSFHEFARTIPRPFGNSILPFYALYPPVYYSYIVPRPYGFSPFALPPGKAPAEALVQGSAAPAEIINPYYRPNDDAAEEVPEKPAGMKSASVMINRHVPQTDSPKQQESAARPAQPGQMIFNPFVDQTKVAVQLNQTQR